MILKFWKLLFCAAWMPLYFGGDSNSTTKTATSNQTTNSATSLDTRSVASEQAVAVGGNNNSIDRSSTTNFLDSSNRSTNFADLSNRSTNFADSSNRSTTFTDASVKDSGNSTSVTNTTTDFGAVGAALAMAGTTAHGAFNLSGDIAKGAVDSLNQTGKNQLLSLSSVLDFASKSSANALTSAQATMGFATAAIDKSNSAFAAAKDGGSTDNLKIMVMGAVAAIGLYAFSKG